ncbi:uncharacterized protein LOC126740737 [Anthonomus grandis grandis]|uniref:uncharacterized protein LOC126740737 n=1 Tax=Anthonomus grandis grandis TaxID=2921223 RepID=UPI002165BB46|nr:uncharacterized protein LOC126740737 [Anthonomus grandis grandis]XP_050302853.1 uncharacterized protein LOC126740737 [Anthonomus grandis grandis]
MDNCTDESVISGSEYSPSSEEDSEEDSDNSNISYSTSLINKYPDVDRVKRKMFPDNQKIKKVPTSSRETPDRIDVIDEVQEEIPREIRIEDHNQQFHVTADGISKREIVKPVLKITKKRVRKPDNWKRNKAAKLRQQGKEYISQKTGKVMEAKTIKRDFLCKEKCRINCTEKFSIASREEILRKFYKLDTNSKKILIFKSIKMQEVIRHRPRKNIKAKAYSFKYFITCDKENTLVCKDAICSLYRIGRKKVFKAQNDLKSGQVMPSPHKQGHYKNPKKISDEVINCIENHIKQFPSEESHYSRTKNPHKKYLSPLLNINRLHQLYIEDCQTKKLETKYFVKASFYRHIFETRFNLSFGVPKSDSSLCDAGENSLEYSNNFQLAFAQQKVDREAVKMSKEKCYITMVLQQTMPLPKLSTSKSFYLRQMWLYNFEVHCLTSSSHKSYFFTWTEDIANRGSNEIACC